MNRLLFFFLTGSILLQGASGGWLGITVQDLNPQMAARLGIRNQEGALIAAVQFGSPAGKAGLEQGDVIISLNGNKISSSEGLKNAITDLAPGTSIRMTIIRNQHEMEIEVMIGTPPREAV